jgi:hypothetical protein
VRDDLKNGSSLQAAAAAAWRSMYGTKELCFVKHFLSGKTPHFVRRERGTAIPRELRTCQPNKGWWVPNV